MQPHCRETRRKKSAVDRDPASLHSFRGCCSVLATTWGPPLEPRSPGAMLSSGRAGQPGEPPATASREIRQARRERHGAGTPRMPSRLALAAILALMCATCTLSARPWTAACYRGNLNGWARQVCECEGKRPRFSSLARAGLSVGALTGQLWLCRPTW